MASTACDHDVVLFGATGFVGRFTAAHLAAHAPSDLRIALAGRSRHRLEQLRSELGPAAADWPLIVADALDDGQTAALAASARVVATTVGPYSTYGKGLVGACAASGTDYVDLTGEVLFVRHSIDANHKQAQRTRARVVHACGFEALPSDLGVWLTARTAAADGAGQLTDTLLHVRSLAGGISGGTIDTARQQALAAATDPQARRVLADPYALSPARTEEPDAAGSRPWARPARPPAPRPNWLSRLDTYGRLHRLELAVRALPVDRAEASGVYSVRSLMAAFNTRIVRRSNALTAWSYGREFTYDEVLDTGSGARGVIVAGGAALFQAMLDGGMRSRPIRSLLDRVLPEPGEGPSPETLGGGHFAVEIEAGTTSGARYLTRFAAAYDPGYLGTAVMFGESALALALDELPDRAGVLTPSTALESTILDRVRRHGFTVTVRRV
ncbi:MAG: saccharopine dehydrogenase NADP-binding domain-containing protein [Kineosporiaceae bacterium]|nr:saccharopine dehydrogenase NADP-binding domain-containing protein [Kineosporiaceae bacterium]